MISEQTLVESYPARPRHAVVFWAIVSFLLSCAALFALLSWTYMPSIYESLKTIDIVVFGKGYVLYDFLAKYGADKLAAFFLLIIPFFFVTSVAEKRAFYLLFSIPLMILVLPYVVGWCCLYLENVYTQILPNIQAILVVGYPYLVYVNVGICIFVSFLCFFYNASYPLHYKEIYALKKARILFSKEHEGDKTPHEIKKAFYRAYKKKNWDDMLDLLYGTVFLKNPKDKITDGEFEYFALCLSKTDEKIRSAELSLLRKSDEWPFAREIYKRQNLIKKSPDCGLRKAREDKNALLSATPYAKFDGQQTRPVAVAPRSLPQQANRAATPTKPVSANKPKTPSK